MHGTNQPQSIGHAVSNGCVRMYNADVEALFDQVQVGVPVLITAGVTAPAPVPGTYVVRAGDTLFLIARRFGTTVDAIRRANSLTTDVISVGQVLAIPGAVARPATTGTDYIVQPGDTLFLIARRYGTTVQALMSANNLTSTNGTWANDSGYRAGQGRSQSGIGGAWSGEYVVQSGDTLSGIASAFGATPEAIVGTISCSAAISTLGRAWNPVGREDESLRQPAPDAQGPGMPRPVSAAVAIRPHTDEID